MSPLIGRESTFVNQTNTGGKRQRDGVGAHNYGLFRALCRAFPYPVLNLNYSIVLRKSINEKHATREYPHANQQYKTFFF